MKLRESEKKPTERWHEAREERLKQAMTQFAQKGPGRRETTLITTVQNPSKEKGRQQKSG